MNAEMMSEYILFVANRLVKQLGHAPLYPNAKQPFSHMNRICFDGKDSFFEGRVTGYQTMVDRGGIEDNIDNLTFSDDF